MTRTTVYKAVYIGVVFGFGPALGVVAILSGAPPQILLPLFLLLLVPGRILGFFWRDLLTGLRLLRQKNYAKSKVYSERFLYKVRKSPWLKHLIWLGTSSYSRDPEVLALNNLGAAEIELGEHDVAKAHLKEAIALDPKCPLPFRNMGVLCLHTGTRASAQPWFEQSVALGYTGGLSDKIVKAAQSRFAATDGWVRSAPVAPAPAAPTSDVTVAVGDSIVQILNDDHTSVEFVIQILEDVFGKTFFQAKEIMLETHRLGRGNCGVYDRETASAKVETVERLVRDAGFPLKCVFLPNSPKPGTAAPTA